LKTLKYFKLSNGREPYRDWLEKLDSMIKARVSAYIDKVVEGGSRKNVRALKDGVFEIKMDFGPGYRVYFGEDGDLILLLLLGGNKRTQFLDIVTAKKYWREYVQKNRI
jgi:putative addiction module killer protein